MNSLLENRVDIAVLDTTVLDAAALLAIAMGGAPDVAPGPLTGRAAVAADGAVVGAWRSPDGAVRLQLRTDGTYAGAVAGRRRQARGTYRVDGASVLLRDDSGLSTPITVLDGELEMAGHRLLPA